MKSAKGFTLIELMIAVAIIAILTAVALPMYTNYVTRGKIIEATSTLSSMRVQMEQYYQDNRSYVITGTNTCGVQIPTMKYFTFTCVNPNPNTPGIAASYLITATGGTPTNPSMSGFIYTIDQQNARTSAFALPASAAGWTAANPNNCWVTNKGGLC
ncbi:MAG TPA: type IV pilin protein [Gallionellaceae bacterium]